MYYAILIYGKEGVFERLPEDQKEAKFQQHRDLQAELTQTNQLGPVVKLMNTTAAITVRQENNSTVVTDGPFAETKEQFLGFYVVNCETVDEAIKYVHKLPLDVACYEIRPAEWADGVERNN